MVGNGGRLSNMGQRSLNLATIGEEATALKSCIQIAKVTRPLMSVGKICDNKMRVVFDEHEAIIYDKSDDSQLCVFTHKPGGLYTCKFRLKAPDSGFARQG